MTIDFIWRTLGISRPDVSRRGLRIFQEADALTVVHTPERDFYMTPDTAEAWKRMQAAAACEGVTITLISAFRSYDYQVGLIKKKLTGGRTIDEVLTFLAPPGCSEHHTGRALDLGTPGCPPVDEAFEKTAAFQWLTKNAEAFGFVMSYPRKNQQGYIYEPWHWRFEA